MNLDLSGRRAVVTGASKGIGLAVVAGLAAEGVSVMAGARTAPDVPAFDGPGRILSHPVDLSEPDGPAALVAAAVDAFGGLDILVNNVGGVHPRTGGFASIDDDDWISTLTINVLAAVRTTLAALPHLLEARGCVVTVASVNARLPDPLVIDYSAAKAALASFSKSLSKEVGPHGVRVNTVSPGPVSTDLWLGLDGVAATVAAASAGVDPDAVAQQAAAGSATGRFTRPDEVANLVVFLASDRCANVTGADFTVDGGLIPTL